MRTVTNENLEIAQIFSFPFECEEYKLGDWGSADFHCIYDSIQIFLEIEKGQKHPNTNVLKYWPYLEDNPTKKILLIQIIRPENKSPKNRLALCKFTGEKMEEFFPDRFAYIFTNWNNSTTLEILELVHKKLMALK